MTEQQIEYKRVRLETLKLDAANPRKMSKKARTALAASVKRFGLVQPIIVNKTTGRVVGGHQRLGVLLEQGVTEADVAIGSWSAAEERALNVALNNPAAQGEFTGDVRAYLDQALQGLSLDDFQALRFDELTINKPKRDHRSASDRRGLEYKLVVECRDEEHQAELLEELEGRGLTVKLLVV
jgi:ParB-like chromosome segregation protein Spo0J